MTKAWHRLHHLQQGDFMQVDHPTRRSHEDAAHAISMHRTCWGAYGAERRETRSDRSMLIGRGSSTCGHMPLRLKGENDSSRRGEEASPQREWSAAPEHCVSEPRV